MLITCPDCGTNFTIPDAALGEDGRKLRCARCGHVWLQEPIRLLDDEPLTFAPDPDPEPEPEAADKDEPAIIDLGLGLGPAAGPPAADPAAFPDIDAPPVPNFVGRIPPERPAIDPADSFMDDDPEPIPDLFTTPPENGSRGATLALWLVLGLLVFCGMGGAIYYFQDRVVDHVPPVGDLLSHLGLRHEKPGAGLELRKAGTPERIVLNEVDVLVVRGIVANISDSIRPVPTMKLVLLDKAGQTVQEKLARPPASALDPQGTVSFKILLERPDPSAVEVVVVFVDAVLPDLPPAAKEPKPTPSAAPSAATAPAASPAMITPPSPRVAEPPLPVSPPAEEAVPASPVSPALSAPDRPDKP